MISIVSCIRERRLVAARRNRRTTDGATVEPASSAGDAGLTQLGLVKSDGSAVSDVGAITSADSADSDFGSMKSADSADSVAIKPADLADSVAIKPADLADSVAIKAADSADSVAIKPADSADSVAIKAADSADSVAIKAADLAVCGWSRLSDRLSVSLSRRSISVASNDTITTASVFFSAQQLPWQRGTKHCNTAEWPHMQITSMALYHQFSRRSIIDRFILAK